MPRIGPLLVLALTLAPLPASAGEPPGDTWMSVTLDGRKIGYLHTRRSVDGDRVRTAQQLSIQLSRAGKPIHVDNRIRTEETLDGKPLAFGADTRMSGEDSHVEGHRIAPGQFMVETHIGGRERRYVMLWPDQARLLEGQMLVLRQADRTAGVRYAMVDFDPSSRSAVDVDVHVLGRERVRLRDGIHELTHVRQSLHARGGAQAMDIWLDDSGRVRKGMSMLLGYHMEMTDCGRACALAENQEVDLIRKAAVDSPRLLTSNLRDQGLRFHIHIQQGSSLQLVQTDEQHATDLGHGNWILDVTRSRPGREDPPDPTDTEPTEWIQSDAPEIRSAATSLVHGASSDIRRMVRLKEYVGHHIRDTGPNAGYASALEAFRSRQGDCTEYALLLTAMARSIGIPARVVTGLVYVDRYGGRYRVFVPHAWVQAWVGGHWRSFDAALGHFDYTHIALNVGDGDPWKYFSSLDGLDRMRVDRATATSELVTMGGGTPAPGGGPAAGAAATGR